MGKSNSLRLGFVLVITGLIIGAFCPQLRERQRAVFQCGMVHLRLALVVGMPDLRAVKEGAWLYGENE